jgi:hypothetical protein
MSYRCRCHYLGLRSGYKIVGRHGRVHILYDDVSYSGSGQHFAAVGNDLHRHRRLFESCHDHGDQNNGNDYQEEQ